MENICFLLLCERNDSTACMRSPLAAPKKKKDKPYASFSFSRISDEKPGFFFIWPKLYKTVL